MAVNPITPLSSRPPADMGGPIVASTRRASRRLRMEQDPEAGQLSRKDWNALILAALANPGALAVANLPVNPAPVAETSSPAAATPVQAITIAADAADAVNAAARSGPDAGAVQDPSGLGADATAKFMGAGFLGPAPGPISGVPGHPSEVERIPSVDGVPPGPALESNTYSNPHERSFGQAGEAQTAPMAPVAELEAGPELDIKA